MTQSTGLTNSLDKGKRVASSSKTLLEALATAIDGTDEAETRRLAAEFNDSFGEYVRASVGVESVMGDDKAEGERPRTNTVLEPPTQTLADSSGKRSVKVVKEVVPISSSDETDSPVAKKKKRPEDQSSDDSQKGKPTKKKKKSSSLRRKSKKKKEEIPSSDPSSDSDSSSTDEDSSEDSSEVDRAELCYDITDFESADLPDLPERWDKGFRKLRSYVPLTLFRPALLESFHDDDVDLKTKDKSALSKSSLKALEKQLTYGDFIEMCDLEERYAREIYGLDTYADYVVKHKKIVSDLKKVYNCWMIALRYHLKVRTVIFRRRKLIKSKVRGKTVVQDKVKIPNGLQPTVERQAKHDAERAGDLQFVDNPYAQGGAKSGFNFTTGRPQVLNSIVVGPEKTVEATNAGQLGLRGRRGVGNRKPFARGGGPTYQRYHRQPFPQTETRQHPYHGEGRLDPNQLQVSAAPVTQAGRAYYQYKSRPVIGATQKPTAVELPAA